MHIDIFRGATSAKYHQWYWHFENKGRITADSEAFPTKQHAVRAAKACVRAVVKRFDNGADHVFFASKVQSETAIRLTWASNPFDLP